MIGEEADVVCIGTGFAGLTAALRAAELGQSVLVLEREGGPKAINNSRVTTGVFHVASNDAMLGEEDLVKAITEESAGYAKPDLTRAIAKDSARAVQWLKDQGAQFHREGQMSYIVGRTQVVLAPVREMKAGLDWPGKGGDKMLELLEAKLSTRNARIVRGVEAQALEMKGAACVGVQAMHDGAKVFYGANKAVVIADGGFQANARMVTGTVTNDASKVRLRATPTGTGDGIRMAQAVGAKITELGAFYGHILAREAMTDERLWPYPNMDVLAVGAILINRQGERFVDEGRGAVFMTNAIAKLDDPLGCSIVMTRAIWDTVGKTGVAPPNAELTNNGGKLIEAPDLAILAHLIDVPSGALAATVAAYNVALKNNELARLKPIRTEKKGKAHPIDAGPYCAVRVCAGLTNTMGGIDIDADCRVLDTKGVPIPGLLAAGSSTGGLEGGPNCGYIGGIVKAFVLGLRAGETAARA